MPDELELSQLMSAKLCHDLAGTVGTIDSCFNLLDHSNKEVAKKAKILASEELVNLVNKIRLFRTAYGLVDAENDISIASVQELINTFFANKKIDKQFYFDSDFIYVNDYFVKLIICLSMIIAKHISYSGEMRFYLNKDHNQPLKFIAKSNSFSLKDDSLEILEGKGNNNSNKIINVTNCLEYYVNRICVKNDYKILISKTLRAIEYKILRNNT